MVGPMTEKSVWILFPVFVSITQFSNFWVMSYENWKYILDVFSFHNSVFNGISVIKHILKDPPAATFDLLSSFFLFLFSFFFLLHFSFFFLCSSVQSFFLFFLPFHLSHLNSFFLFFFLFSFLFTFLISIRSSSFFSSFSPFHLRPIKKKNSRNRA